MTYLEKLKQEHPDWDDRRLDKYIKGRCPRLTLPGCCPVHGPIRVACPICWNREIPGTEPTNKTENNEREDTNMKNKKFTKDDLKVGYVVKFRRGDLRMVMPSASGHLLVVGVDGGNGDIPRYNDDLTHMHSVEWVSGFKSLDIMEVYGLSRFDFNALEISTEGRELLWKREPEKTCDDCAHKVVCPHVGMCEHFMAKN